ncbi:MAG: hypothetical protein HRT90_02520 [Candidatus Margulisbacteria bacterium]|nr:hypothetical protein [Candidatus Margulisiibacteriota bacterium]
MVILQAMRWVLILSMIVISFLPLHAEDEDSDALHCEICGDEITSGKVYEVEIRMRFKTERYFSVEEYQNGIFGNLPRYFEIQTILLGDKCGNRYEDLIKDPPRGQDRKSVIIELMRSYLIEE